MSDVIWTTWNAAHATAELFTPPATVNHIGDFVVECTASLPPDATIGVGIQGKHFYLAKEDLIVARADNTCVSAVQARGDNDISRLGWPFLKNVLLFFDHASNTDSRTVQITARAAGSSGKQVSTVSASSVGTTTNPTTSSTFSTSTTQAPK